MIEPNADNLAALVGLSVPTDSPAARYLVAIYEDWEESLLIDYRHSGEEHARTIARIGFRNDREAWQAFVDLGLYGVDLDLSGTADLAYPSRLTESLVYQSLHALASELLDLLEDGGLYPTDHEADS